MMSTIKTIDELNVTGRRVLVRVDFNVPLKNGVVTDDTRIREELPTLKALIARGAKVILASHLGRPKGERNAEFSLAPVAPVLAEKLGVAVKFVDDCAGDSARAAAMALQNGEVLLLENTRFYKGEEKNDEALAKELASLAEVYVNDAFGSAHRAHSSTTGVAQFVAEKGCGYLMQKELRYLGTLLSAPERPFWAVLGGAKVSDKIGVVKNLLDKVDGIVVGGAMALTFLAAKGVKLGKSKLEVEAFEMAREALALAEAKGVKLLLPIDHVAADAFAETAKTTVATNENFPDEMMGLDVGPATAKLYAEHLVQAKTIFWNGPMGVFEMAPFAAGTVTVAKAVATPGITSVIGGGDSVAAAAMAGVTGAITHISTGGGASLELMEGMELPGVAALRG